MRRSMTAAVFSLLAPAALLAFNAGSAPQPVRYAPTADAIEQAVDNAQSLVEDEED